MVDAFAPPSPSLSTLPSLQNHILLIDDGILHCNSRFTNVNPPSLLNTNPCLHSTLQQSAFLSHPSSFILSAIDNIDIVDTIGTSSSLDPLQSIAQILGYFIGVASLLLYTPIAVRILRTKSANGLVLSTWWLKLSAFTCTDVYNIKNGFPIEAFSETVVITVEAAVVLGLVAYYQKKLNGGTFGLMGMYVALTVWALFSPEDASWGPTEEGIALAQVAATVMNASALVPQLAQNFQRKSSGDYSPITAALGVGGCTIRLFTTFELANGDPLLLLNYGVALVLNASVLSQLVYYGTQMEGTSLSNLFVRDVKSAKAMGK